MPKVHYKANENLILELDIEKNKLQTIRFIKPDEFKKKLATHNAITTWLDAYFKGKPKKTKLILNLIGTDFQRKVWKTIAKIPYGRTKSYAEIANEIGNPKAVRAVGTACGANPIPVIIPCHRVTAKNGIGGFSSGLKIKKALMSHEEIDYYL